MEARAKILGHPIHQMLMPFPFGLLATAVIFDIIYIIWGNPTMGTVAYWMIVAGIVGGLLAAPFGLIDWLAIPQGTRAKSVGLHLPTFSDLLPSAERSFRDTRIKQRK